MTDTAETWLQPAPKRLAMLAEAMRDGPWDYENTWQAIKACHDAGWTDIRIYQETFRLLLIKDSAPDDLRHLARTHRPGAGLPKREDAVALVAAYRARVAAQAEAGSGPEGDEAA